MGTARMMPPIDYIEGFVAPGAVANCFSTIWEHTPWERRDGAPRREYWLNPYGMPYTYGSGDRARTYEGHPYRDTFTGMIVGGMIEEMYPWIGGSHNKPDCCFINGYEDGKDHLGWHADDSPEMDHGYPICVVSLGAAREIWVRPKDHKGEIPPEWRFLLEPGSLFVMRGGMQREWQHRIPKADHVCGPRVSLTYRKLVEADVISRLLEKARAR